MFIEIFCSLGNTLENFYDYSRLFYFSFYGPVHGDTDERFLYFLVPLKQTTLAHYRNNAWGSFVWGGSMAAGQDMKISSVRVTPEGSTHGEENVLQPAVGSQEKNDCETQGPWKMTRVCSGTAMHVS